LGVTIIKNRLFLTLAVIGITGSIGLLTAVRNNGLPSFKQRPTPTLAHTASVELYLAQVVSEVTDTATPLPPTNTPIPTDTPAPTATDTATAVPPTNTPQPTATDTPEPTATNTPPPPPPTNTPPPLPTNPPPTEAPPTEPPPPPPPPASNPILDLGITPGQPQGFLDKFRVVSFYGSPLGSGLGKLGDYSRSHTLATLRRDYVSPYQALSSDRLVLPGYHIIATVANTYPPDYRHHLDLAIIEEWVAAAKETGVVVFLDIQPGRANVMDEFNRIRYLLYEPHVHLAIDPEFTMNEEQVVGQNVGQLYASQINEVQASMNGIGYEIGLNKVLMIHQFRDKMLPDKPLIEPYPFVELLIDGDGVGPDGPKIRNYNQYAGEPGFEYGGFKLFPTDGDVPLMSPEYVMSALFPQPVVIIYQ
jgi:hypothetical protein